MKNERKFDFTVAEGLENILQVLRGEKEVTQIDIDFLNDRLEKAKNKNKSRASVERPENTEILEKVIEILKDGQKRTLKELVEELKGYTYTSGKDTKEVTTSKLSSVLQKEVFEVNENGEKVTRENSRVTRIDEGKGKLYFTIKE